MSNVNSAGSRNRWYRVLHRLHYLEKVHPIVWQQKKTYISSYIACEPVRPQVQKWHHITILGIVHFRLSLSGRETLTVPPLSSFSKVYTPTAIPPLPRAVTIAYQWLASQSWRDGKRKKLWSREHHHDDSSCSAHSSVTCNIRTVCSKFPLQIQTPFDPTSYATQLCCEFFTYSPRIHDEIFCLFSYPCLNLMSRPWKSDVPSSFFMDS